MEPIIKPKIETELDEEDLVFINQKYYTPYQSKWVNRYSNKKKSLHFPSRRYGHTSVTYRNWLYVYGGAQKHKTYDNSKGFIYKLNIDTWQWQKIITQVKPNFRDSHSCCVLNDKMILFGGSDNQKCFNDLWAFSFQSGEWVELDQIGYRPTQRDLCHLISYDPYLILYGGMNSSLELVFNEALIYHVQQKSWKSLKLENEPEPRIGESLVGIKQKLYLFGGYKISSSSPYLNDFYQIQVDIKDLKLKYTKIQTMITPSVRSFHGMIEFSDNYILVVGGQGCYQSIEQKEEEQADMANKMDTRNNLVDKQKIEKQEPQKTEAKKQPSDENPVEKTDDGQNQSIYAKKDTWVFNIKHKKWIRIFPKNAQFKSRLLFSISRHENNILIFGGMKNQHNLYDELMILNFLEQKPVPKPEPCRLCLIHAQQTKQYDSIKQSQKYSSFLPIMSNNFIYSIAMMQHFAFNAVSLIVDSALLVKAEYVRVAIRKRISDLSYIAIEFSGASINNKGFVELMTNRQIEKGILNEFSNNIKFGGFRLGRTFLYINREPPVIRVALFSVNSNIVPNSESKYKYFGYIQNLQTNTFLTEFGRENKTHILNFLSSQLEAHQTLLNQKQTHSIYIFEMNLITTSKSIYYYELINNSSNDIRILVNHRKIEFLDELGYNISQQPDISLRSYLSVAYMNSNLKIYINEMDNPLEYYNYRQKLQNYENKQLIQKVHIDNIFPEVKTIEIYKIADQSDLEDPNLGLLIYRNKRLLMRYQTEFGKLFCEKFYRTKYKKKKFHIFTYLGIIEINDEFLNVNLIKTDLENNQFSQSFWTKLKNILKEHKTAPNKGPQNQQLDIVAKKLKTN